MVKNNNIDPANKPILKRLDLATIPAIKAAMNAPTICANTINTNAV